MHKYGVLIIHVFFFKYSCLLSSMEHRMFVFIVEMEQETVLQQIRLLTNNSSFDKHFTNATMSVRCENSDNNTCPVCTKNKYVFQERVLVIGLLFVFNVS